MNGKLPLLVQSDGTLLLDTRHPLREQALEALRPVAALIKRPGCLHTYRMTPVTLWNASAAGETADTVLERLRAVARFGIPPAVEAEIRERMASYGRFRLINRPEGLFLLADRPQRLREAFGWPEAAACFLPSSDAGETCVRVREDMRGRLKQLLAQRGCPIADEAGTRSGRTLGIAFRELSRGGAPIRLRPYQAFAAEAFAAASAAGEGGGVVVLPCGAGKTWVGMAAMAKLQCETLILTPNAVSVTQWIRELLDHTTLREDQIGEYSGARKQVRPVTVATYQILAHRSGGTAPNPHGKLFGDRDWGLIIYDEVHLLPAPVFRMTAELQATRRLGLSATLVREDGREADVFSLIGPLRYELGWKQSEREGWTAEASCTEVRVRLDAAAAARYRNATTRARHRIAGENPAKREVVRRLLNRHEGSPALVIGQYLDQLRRLADELGLPLVTGEMPHDERRRIFDRFNRGELAALVVSKVANFAVDLPDAAVAIQVSGSFGSRQEEAQRLGRILRPKGPGIRAAFYSLVSEGTGEVDFARNRERFLIEQGYTYEVDRWASEAEEGAIP